MKSTLTQGIAGRYGLGALAIPALAALLLMNLAEAHARTKLVALPERSRLALSLDHPAVNLVTEERILTLQQGSNAIDFSWQGVSIDAESIQIQMLDHPGEEAQSSKVLNVSYPPNENALTWEIFTPEARTERVRILYLLQGFTRQDSYEAFVSPDETSASLRSYFQLTNRSGEDLAAALIRRGFAEEWTKDLKNGETRKLLAFTNPAMPVRKIYLSEPDPESQRGDEGEIIQLVYPIENTTENGFGKFMLPEGKVRIFQEDKQGSSVFLGEDVLKSAPVKEKRYLSLGQVKDVTVKRRIMSDQQINVKRNTSRDIALYDRRVHIRYELQNFKNIPATLKIVEQMEDDWTLEELDAKGIRHEIKSNRELEIFIDLDPRPADEKAEVPKREVNFIYVLKNQFPSMQQYPD